MGVQLRLTERGCCACFYVQGGYRQIACVSVGVGTVRQGGCLSRLVSLHSGKVVGIVAKVHEYNGSCLLFRVFASCLRSDNVSPGRVVGISLRGCGGQSLEGPSGLCDCMRGHVTDSKVCCLLLSRIRVLSGFTSMLGKFLGVHGLSICIANDGTGFLSGSVIARFHNHNFRVGVCPLDFDRCVSTCPNDVRTKLGRCVLCKKLPRVLSCSARRRGIHFLGSLFSRACVGSVGSHCRVHGSSSLRRLVGVVTSKVNTLAGPGGLTGAFQDRGGSAVSCSAVGTCASCLYSSFLIRGSAQCSVGKGECVGSPFGCCFVSLNLHGTEVGFHRSRGDRLVRGLVCGRLEVHKFGISINTIPFIFESGSNGRRHAVLRVSFIYGLNDEQCCVRSTCEVKASRGRGRRHTSLAGISSSFGGVVVVKRRAPVVQSRANVAAVDVRGFLLGRGSLRL